MHADTATVPTVGTLWPSHTCLGLMSLVSPYVCSQSVTVARRNILYNKISNLKSQNLRASIDKQS